MDPKYFCFLYAASASFTEGIVLTDQFSHLVSTPLTRHAPVPIPSCILALNGGLETLLVTTHPSGCYVEDSSKRVEANGGELFCLHLFTLSLSSLLPLRKVFFLFCQVGSFLFSGSSTSLGPLSSFGVYCQLYVHSFSHRCGQLKPSLA